MKPRVLPLISALVLILSAASPTLAHDGEHTEGGKQESGWPGSAKGQEVARAFLADSQPAQDLEAQATTTCTDGSAADYPCRNVDLLSFLPLGDIGGGKGNDIWGWTDPETGSEYAIMGRTTGTAFVDISVPTQPVYLGNLPTTRFSSTWRDIKVHANHAYIVSESRNHGMQVFDLTRLRGLTGPVTFSADATYTGFSTAHNIAINEATGFAYAIGTNTCSGGLHIVDIRTPTSPVHAGCFSGDGYTHDVQCVNSIIDGWVGRELCFASNEDTLTIVDVTNKGAPVQLARLPYTGAEYTHQGWLTDDQRYFLIDDELDEGLGFNTRTYVFDVADPTAPVHVGTHEGTTPAIDHNQYVVGDHTFQANYRSGLRILRLNDVTSASLEEVAFFDIYPADDQPEFNGAWSVYPFFASGTVVVSGIEQGLFVLRPNLGGNTAPSVTLEQPAEGAIVTGNGQPIVIAASDTVDSAATLTVEWRVDEGAWQPATYDPDTDRYEASWDSTLVGDGDHALSARATDTVGASATDTNAVTVDNVPDEPAATMHVGDLDGARQLKGKSGRWEVFVTVTVHDDSENLLGGVTVNGTFGESASGSVSGTTASDGTVTFSTGTLSGGDTVTFTVDALSGTLTYDQTANHNGDAAGGDGDGSNGTTITVTRT